MVQWLRSQNKNSLFRETEIEDLDAGLIKATAIPINFNAPIPGQRP
jgi:hypothetical protein